MESAGSPVLNTDTLLVEGVVSRGDVDFVREAGASCSITNVCEDDGCLGETVTRTTEFDSLVPPDLNDVRYRVRFGRCGEELELLGETRETSWTLEGRLEPGVPYCWRVTAINECGTSTGPEWTFITDAALDPVFKRADANQDDVVNLSDGIAILQYLFQGGDVPGCLAGTDADDSGQTNLSDPILVLNYLFNQGPPPSPPFESCDVDPTPDDLGCEAFAPCEG